MLKLWVHLKKSKRNWADVKYRSFLLRAVELGLSMNDLSELTIGLVNDMYIEKNNDSYDYKLIATQEDMDNF